MLRDVTDRSGCRPMAPRRIVLKHPDGARVRLEQTANQPQRRRFAGPVWANHAKHLAGGHVERQSIERDRRPESLTDIGERYRGGHCGAPASSTSTGIPGFRMPLELSTVTLT